MNQNIKALTVMLLMIACSLTQLAGQGPPITADKPIMLGGGSVILKSLTEIRNTEDGTFVRAPFMAHYLPTSNSLVALHIPFIHASSNIEDINNGGQLGDIGLLAKYQFYRKDGKGKTFRMVAKTFQNFPTGEAVGPEEVNSGKYSSYLGVVAGRESIKYGLSWELGYNIVPDGDFDEFRAKFGVGLPLLRPLYPVNQINLYFEYAYKSRAALDEKELLFAQGVQYAVGRLTLEAAVQLPIYQKVNRYALKTNILLGTRYIF